MHHGRPSPMIPDGRECVCVYGGQSCGIRTASCSANEFFHYRSPAPTAAVIRVLLPAGRYDTGSRGTSRDVKHRFIAHARSTGQIAQPGTGRTSSKMRKRNAPDWKIRSKEWATRKAGGSTGPGSESDVYGCLDEAQTKPRRKCHDRRRGHQQKICAQLLQRRRFCLEEYTVKFICISMDILWRVFHILTEPHSSVGLGFIITSIYGYKRIRNRFP